MISGTSTVSIVIVQVVLVAHCIGNGVNNNIELPFCPVGSKKLLTTPGPDQFPATPFCTVFKFCGAAFSQTAFGTPVIDGVKEVYTVTTVEEETAHWPNKGVNNSGIAPFNPFGLNILFTTPCPVQFPVMPC